MKEFIDIRDRLDVVIKRLDKQITIQELQQALTKGFEKTFNVEFEKSELTNEEKQLANKLYQEKYSSKEWTNQR